MNETCRVAIITGGAQGIGRATVDRLLREGWTVVIADNDAEALAEAEAGFRAVGPCFGALTDVSDEAQVRGLIADTVARYGGLDLVMNNAYASLPWTALDTITSAKWQRVLDVNLTGAFLTTKYAVPHLRARRGLIVNIASIMALRTYPNTVGYSATKGGLISLTHALALSLGPDIRVNCICPGIVNTYPWVKSARSIRRKGYPEEVHRMHPAGRVGDPEDIAGIVHFLTTPDAAFITGQNFVIDGGAIHRMRAGSPWEQEHDGATP